MRRAPDRSPRIDFEPSHVRWQGMALCFECGELAGEWFWSDTAPSSLVVPSSKAPREQVCRCEEAWRQELGLRGPRWPGFDFSRALELCHCCAVALIASGHDDAPYFCPECRVLTLAFHERVGRPVFPTGRTVETNDTLPLGAVSGMPSAVQRHIRAGRVLHSAVERLQAWRRSRIRSLACLAGYGLDTPTELERFLGDVGSLSADRDACFGEMKSAFLNGMILRRPGDEGEQRGQALYTRRRIGG